MRLNIKTTLSLSAIAGAAFLASCASAPAPAQDMRTVDVTATYRERIMLTPGHKLTVTLADVSLADAPARELDRVEMTLDGRSPPYQVRLKVPANQIDQRHEYAVRAEIRDPSGALRFTTDTRHSVLTRGASDAATITMIGVR